MIEQKYVMATDNVRVLWVHSPDPDRYTLTLVDQAGAGNRAPSVPLDLERIDSMIEKLTEIRSQLFPK